MGKAKDRSHFKTTLGELIKYGLIGLVSNVLGYLAFLIITYYGVEPKLAMTILYISTATLAFFGNKRLTFKFADRLMESSVRYIITHIIGYAINLTILIVFMDILGYSYHWVQAVAIFIVAGFLFLMFKYFVFPKTVPDNRNRG